MTRYIRSKQLGGTFFFTVVTHQRRRILIDPAVRRALRDSIIKTRKIMKFHTAAWVLLPDHIHAIWTLPAVDNDFSKRWGLIKAGVSKSIKHLYDRDLTSSQIKRHESGIWQRRFWEHQIRDETDYIKHLDYLHYNPVKHGLVQAVKDWPYSSFHRFVKNGKYTLNWASECNTQGAFGE